MKKLTILVGVAALAGCTDGVLDPQGPIAAAERQILFNSLGIMLAIVIPTIFATLIVAFLVPLVQRARPLPAGFHLFRSSRDIGLVDSRDDRAVGWRRRMARRS